MLCSGTGSAAASSALAAAAVASVAEAAAAAALRLLSAFACSASDSIGDMVLEMMVGLAHSGRSRGLDSTTQREERTRREVRMSDCIELHVYEARRIWALARARTSLPDPCE